MDGWQLQSTFKTNTDTQAVIGLDNVTSGLPSRLTSVASSPPQPVGACTLTTTVPQPSSVADVVASVGVPSGHPTLLVGSNPGPIPPQGLQANASVDATTRKITLLGDSVSCANWPCLTYAVVPDTGSSDSLADVAQYYYATDLRTGEAWPNNVTASPSANWEDDRASHQHMSTYVVGLGVSGNLLYNPDYRSLAQVTGDFADIRTGPKNWPVWPTKVAISNGNYNDAGSIDDFWHAAVNGRGRYFSAADAFTLVSSIRGALDSIDAVQGAGAGATISTATPTTTDNAVFIPSFKLKAWTGDLQARAIDVTTALVSTIPAWSAQTSVGAMVSGSADTRRIVLREAGASLLTTLDNLMDFHFLNLSGAQQAYFSKDLALNADSTIGWSQTGSMNAAQLAAAPGDSLVRYLRGQTANEDFSPGDVAHLYRKRESVLGDIIGSQPVYVAGPSFPYKADIDAGYAAFKEGTAARKKMVYVGANDGMLHAFYAPAPADANLADAGKEAWAYIPSQVLPNLYKLADVQYSMKHQFFVDGTPTVGDVYDVSDLAHPKWRTILVGGLNAGGKGYYALDITDPDKPISLWEYSVANSANIGLSFGRPIISKLNDSGAGSGHNGRAAGTWVVMFTSGYNTADGHGYLYVLDAVTGVVARSTMTTGVLANPDTGVDAGTPTSPSGLREINNWVDDATDNTTQRVYGGDLLGNVWRFDVNGSGSNAMRLAVLTSVATPAVAAVAASGTSPAVPSKPAQAAAPQPITTRIGLQSIKEGNSPTAPYYPYLFVGTGRLLSTGDLVDQQVQSVYSFKDMDITYTANDVLNSALRNSLKPLTLTANLVGDERTVSCSGSTTVCASNTGWVYDLPDIGERMNVDSKLGKSTLAFVTSVPGGDFCSNGHSWLNYVDLATGLQVTGASNASVMLYTTAMAVGLGLIDADPAGLKAITLGAGGGTPAAAAVPWASPPVTGKRISWREVVR